MNAKVSYIFRYIYGIFSPARSSRFDYSTANPKLVSKHHRHNPHPHPSPNLRATGEWVERKE